VFYIWNTGQNGLNNAWVYNEKRGLSVGTEFPAHLLGLWGLSSQTPSRAPPIMVYARFHEWGIPGLADLSQCDLNQWFKSRFKSIYFLSKKSSDLNHTDDFTFQWKIVINRSKCSVLFFYSTYSTLWRLIFARDSVCCKRAYAISQFRLSVCLSVCPSHGWISQKRLKLGSCNFHRTVAPSI